MKTALAEAFEDGVDFVPGRYLLDVVSTIVTQSRLIVEATVVEDGGEAKRYYDEDVPWKLSELKRDIQHIDPRVKTIEDVIAFFKAKPRMWAWMDKPKLVDRWLERVLKPEEQEETQKKAKWVSLASVVSYIQGSVNVETFETEGECKLERYIGKDGNPHGPLKGGLIELIKYKREHSPRDWKDPFSDL